MNIYLAIALPVRIVDPPSKTSANVGAFFSNFEIFLDRINIFCRRAVGNATFKLRHYSSHSGSYFIADVT